MNPPPNPPAADEESLFARALELPAEARAAFLDEACAGDPARLCRLEALLRALARSPEFLEQPVTEAASPPASASEGPGAKIGRYKLLQQIGEGGCGTVFMAEQEEPVRRRVALKLIKLGMDTKSVIARFEAERQALAMMDHPNIAKVLDAGATETGRPYFVMELVRGVPVTEFCEQHRLSIHERLELFIGICEAVQHAHQKGIVHRDLKPSNILVAEIDGRPHPKIIDFGVAKATAQRLTEKTLFTQFHQVIGTPAYMSPEQAGANREDVDTRSDIYSLGVLLYELLSGRTPFDTKRLLAEGYEAILRTIREQEPPRPSTRLSTLTDEERCRLAAERRATPERLSRLLRGGLDWVVMKALEKERGRRYATAAEFAGDLARHLRNEPVTAAPASVAYRARRFLVRNRVAVSFAGVVGLLLLAATVLAVRSALVEGRQKREVAAQRDIATNQATLARDANERAQRTLGELSDTLSQIELQQVAQLLEPDSFGRNDVGLAVAHLARSLRQNPADFRAAYRLLALFMQRDFARPVSEHRYNGAILSAAWVGPRLLLAVADTNQAPDGGSAVTLFDHSSGRPLQGPLLDGAGLEACGLSPSGRHFWAARNQPGTTRRRIVVGAVATGRAAGPEFVVGAAPRRVVFDIEEGRLLIQLSDSRASPAQCRIEVFDIPSGQMLGRPSELPDIAQDMVTFDATGRRSILPSNRGAASIGLLDIETGKVEPLSLDTFAGAKAQIENERALRRGEAGQLGSVLATQPGPPTDAPVIVPLPWRQDLRRVFSPDGLLLAVIDEKSYQVQVWSLGPTRAQAQPLPHPAAGSPLPYGSLRAVEMDPDGRRLVGTFSTNQGGVIEMNHVVVWDPRRAQVVTTFCPWGDGIQHVCLSPDAERVLVLSKGRARLFSAVDGHLRGQVWGVSTNDGWLLAGGTFSPDGGRVLVWSPAGEGVVRRVDSFTPVGGFGPHGGTETESGGTAVMAARMSPAGDRVATYGRGKLARVWEPATGREVGPPLPHDGRITTADFTPDGETLVTASEDGTVRVWNLRTGAVTTPPMQHGAPVVEAVVLPQAGRIASVGRDRNLKLWDLRTGSLLRMVGEAHGGHEPEYVSAGGGRLLINVGLQPCVIDPVTGLRLSDQSSSRRGLREGVVSRDGSLLAAGFQPEVSALPTITGSAPRWLAELAEALVTRRLTDQAVAESIPFAEAQRTIERLRSPPGDDPFARWARWYLERGQERAANPGVEVGRAGYLRLAVASGDRDAIEQALELEPDNVPLLEALAGLLGVEQLPGRRSYGSEAGRLRFQLLEAESTGRVAGRLLGLAPESTPGWQLKAVAHALLQETNQALVALARATREPVTADEWLVRAFVLEAAGRVDEADAAHDRAVAADGRSPDWQPTGSARGARQAFLRRHNRQETALLEALAERGIMPRDPATDPRLLDLGPHYSGSLANPMPSLLAAQADLAELPGGVNTFAGVPFDARGVAGRPFTGLVVQRPARRLHFLQGAFLRRDGLTDGVPMATVVVQYADGQRVDIPVIRGRHVQRLWFFEGEMVGVPEAEVAWIGSHAHSRLQQARLRLFRRTWENPRPDATIAKLDLEMEAGDLDLVVLAITADDGALPPGPPQDLGVRAEIAEATGRAEEALPLVEQALHARPDDPRLQIVKARALASLGRQPEAIEMIAPQLAQPDAALGGAEARRALLGLRSGWFRALGREAEALADALLARGIRLRDPALPPELLDLSAHYNRLPLGGWLSGEDDSLVGVQTLDGVRFDIRGRVQLGGPENLRKVYPTVVTNLPVNRPVRRLHALHATLGTDAPGTKIASLQLHFADGRRHELPIVFGEDVLGLYADSDQGQPARSTVAWRGRDQTGSSIRLFHSAWAIPFPETVVTVLDYVSAETACSPFLIGLTVE